MTVLRLIPRAAGLVLLAACTETLVEPDSGLPSFSHESAPVWLVMEVAETSDAIDIAHVVIDKPPIDAGDDGTYSWTDLPAGPGEFRCIAFSDWPDGTMVERVATSVVGNAVFFDAQVDIALEVDGPGVTVDYSSTAFGNFGTVILSVTTVSPCAIYSPPNIDVDLVSVEVDEGQEAANSGTVAYEDAVTLRASVGEVTNNNDGTWHWSFVTTDGPAESQTVTITADDGNGGEATVDFELTVNNVAPTVTSITLPNALEAIGDRSVSASGTFMDPAGLAHEVYSCTVDYGDGAGPKDGTISGTTCGGPGQIYTETGRYFVTVAVTDKDGGTGSLTVEMFIVSHDANGGFVTGSGWIDSPAGAYVADPSLTGKATFGFTSRYRPGRSTPDGNVEFQFNAGDVNFHSSRHEFLAITMGETNAIFKGSGTINNGLAPNGTEFRFMIWARDHAPDTFRIRIWWEAADGTEVDIYDNGLAQEIGGGSISIHTKKY